MKGGFLPQRCPYLGLRDDPQTWLAFAAPANHCHRPTVPQPVTPAHQDDTCLTAAYTACPVYQHAKGWNGPLPKGILGRTPDQELAGPRRWPIIAAAAGALLLIGTAAAWFLLRGTGLGILPAGAASLTATLLPLAASPVPDTPLPTPITDAVPSVLPAAPTASLTAPPATPVLATATLPPSEAALAFESNLRDGPGLDFDVITVLEAETVVTVLGRDETTSWLFVRTPGNLVGWVAVIQFQEGLELDMVPVRIGVEATAAPTATLLITAAAEPTATAQAPSTFRISLYSAQKGLSCYSDLQADYRFTITGGLLSVLREDDGSVILGTYDASSGAFEATATYYFGIEYLTGTISFDGELITVEGEQRVSYFERPCDGLWDISGVTTADVSR